MEKKIKEKWGWKRAVAIMVAFSAILNGIPEVAALDTRGDPAKKTVLTYEEQNEKYQVKEFTLTEQAKAQWDDSFRSFNEWTVEQGYDRAEEAFNENGMVYVNEETDNEEIPLFSEAVNDVEEMPKTVALTTYAGDGDSHYIWRLCKAVAAEGEETQAITETGEAATEITEAEVETASELEETFDNKEAETEAVTQYFWVRTKEKIDLESYNEDDTQEKVEGEPEEIIDNPEEQPEAAEDNVVEEPLEESDSNARSTLTDVRASADVIVTSWAQLKSAVESTPAYGSKTIGIGTSFSSTRDVIHFGANAGVNIKVVNMGNYVINCSTRADADAVATEGGAIRVKNGATVTFENLKFDGGMTSSIESAARSNSAALHNGTNLSGASTNFAFIGIQSGSLDIVGDQSAMYNFRFTYDNRACLIATGCFNSSSSAVLNIRQGRFYNNWGIDGSLVLTQGQRAVTNVYGGEYDHNFVRDEGLFDVYDLYHGALNFYGGTIHDNYGTAWDGTLSSTVAICDLRTAQGLAQGSIRLYFRGSGNGNSGIRVYNNYHLRNSGNAFVTLGSGQELASNMGLIWNWEATTGAKIKENSQHAVLFDMTPEDHLQIGPTTFIKNTTGHYSPDGQISLAMGAGMSGAPYGYFSDTNSEDGIADGMYLDYDYSTNSAMLGGKRYGLYEGDLPSGVSPVYYNGKTINKMLYLTDRTADITYNLYVKSGNNVTQLTSLNGTRYPMTKRIGLPADYRVAITAPVDSSGRYVATEYKWGDEGSTNALTNGSTPKKTLSNGQPYTINIYYKDSTVPDPAKYTVSASVSGGNGSVAPASQSVTAGGSASVTFTPNNGYRINTVTDNGANVTGQVVNNRYTINNVQANHNIVATYRSITPAGEGSFKIKKVDANTKTPLAGATFYVTSGQIGLPYDQTVTTNSQGLIELTKDFQDTITGEIYIEEKTAPTGYEKASGKWTVRVENGTAVSVSYSNPSDPVYGTVTKGSDGYWVFPNKRTVQQYAVTAQVSGGHGSVAPASQIVTAGNNASVTFTPDNGYRISSVTDNGINVTNQVTDNRYSVNNVQGNHSIVVTYAATGEGSFKIKKVDANSKVPLAGVSFLVTSDSVDLPYKQTVTTNSQGLAEVTNGFKPTATGELYIWEQTAPSGYEKPTGQWTVKVENGTAVSVKYSNPADLVYGTVTKGNDGYWIFQNKKTVQQYTVTAQVSGGHGSVAPESQTVTEGSSASVAFTPDNGYIIGSVTDNGTNVTNQVKNNRYSISNVQGNHSIVVTYIATGEGSFKIKKVDANSKAPLAGASFLVTSDSVDLPYKQTVTTNSQGLAEVTKDFKPTATGELYIWEQTAPSGYEKPTGQWTVKVENGTAVSVKYSNPADPVYGTVTKGNDGYWIFQNKKTVQQYTVTAQVSGGHGSVAPESQTVTEGNSASVTFTPEKGYQIYTVTDNGTNVTSQVANNRYMINNVQANHSIVVTYSAIGEDEFRIKKVDAQNGNALQGAEFYSTSSSVALPHDKSAVTNASGIAKFPFTISSAQGTFVLEERTVPNGYEKPSGKWTVKVENGTATSVTYSDGSDNTYKVTKDSDGYWVFKNKSINKYSVTAEVSGGNGKVEPETQTVGEGESATITLTPNNGYQIGTVTDNGANVTNKVSGGKYTITNVQESHKVVVTYSRKQFTVTAQVSGGNGNAAPKTQDVGFGDSATITFTPNAGYQVNTVTDNGIDVTSKVSSNNYTVTNVRQNHAIVVTYSATSKYTLMYDASPYNDMLDMTGDVPVDHEQYEKGEIPEVLGDTGSLRGIWKNRQEYENRKYVLKGWSRSEYQPWNSMDYALSDIENGSVGYHTTGNTGGITKDGTLYPVFDLAYDLTYDANWPGDVEDSQKSGKVPDIQEYIRIGTQPEIQGNTGNLMTKDDSYTFLGWSRDKNAKTAEYQEGDIYNTTGTTGGIVTHGTLYGVWTTGPRYTLTYDTSPYKDMLDMSGDVPVDLNQYKKGDIPVVLGDTGNLRGIWKNKQEYENRKYVLKGWSRSTIEPWNNMDYAISDIEEQTVGYHTTGKTGGITKDGMLYPVFDLAYDLVYDANWPNDVDDAQKSGDIPDTQEYIRTNIQPEVQGNTGNLAVADNSYTFLGWSRDANATTAEYSAGDKYNTTGNAGGIVANGVLYAVWEKANVPKVEICPLTFDESTGKLVDKNGTEITEGFTIENETVTFTDDIFRSCTIEMEQHTDEFHHLIIKMYSPKKYAYSYRFRNPNRPVLTEEREELGSQRRKRAGRESSPPVAEGEDKLTISDGKASIYDGAGTIVGLSQRRIYLTTKEHGPCVILREILGIRYIGDGIIAGQSSDADTPPIIDETGSLTCLDLTFKEGPTTENTHFVVAGGAEVPGAESKKLVGYAGYNKRIQVVDGGANVTGKWLVGNITITNQDAANLNKAYIRGTATDSSDTGYTDDQFSFSNEFGTTFPMKAAPGDSTMQDGRNGRYKDVRFQNQVKLLDVSIPINAIDFMVERRGTGRADKGLRSGEAEIENNSMYCWDYYTNPDTDNPRIKTFGVQSSEVGVDYMGITLNETKHVGYKLKNYANVSDRVMNTPVTGQPIVCLDAVADSKRIPLDEETPVSTGTPWFTLPAATTSDTNTSWDNADITAPGVAKIKLEVPEGYTDAKPYCQASDKLDSKNNIALTASHKLSYKLTFKEPKNQWPMQ